MNNSLNRQDNDKLAYSIIGVVSFVVLAFLTWLIYFNEGQSTHHSWVEFMPAINAGLNSVTTVLLFVGYILIKRGHKEAHIRTMLSATGTSALFLVSYIIYHHFHGDTKFMGEGFIRPIYFFILITHIILSGIMVPMIFATLWHGLRKNYSKHKRIAKWTFPIWIYVSFTGVAIYFLLKNFG